MRQPAMDDGRYNPAYAGTTTIPPRFLLLLSIQPRVCGDYDKATIVHTALADTTPRMRGLLCYQRRSACSTRYNPAYAGTTPSPRAYMPARAIQPRVCGDYAECSHALSVPRDTTPRMRGLRRRRCTCYHSPGYNPAYAGTTIASTKIMWMKTIQPRVCGDYGQKLHFWPSRADTTPRMRGLLLLDEFIESRKRYNPAYAGTT